MPVALVLFALCKFTLQEVDAVGSRDELRIVATIDGTDELHLSHARARWNHLGWDWPSGVSINGVSWIPQDQPLLERATDAAFFNAKIDLAGATVERLRGRAKVDFRQGPEGLVISFDDGEHGGAAEVEVLVRFAAALVESRRSAPETPDPPVRSAHELRIRAHIDGREEVHLGPTRADWLHIGYAGPQNVELDGRVWPAELSALLADPEAPFFHADEDLSAVELEVVQARGSVDLRHGGGRLILGFDDGGPFGADDYEVVLRFPGGQGRWLPDSSTGRLHLIELRHAPAAQVAFAPLTVLARSGPGGAFEPWPGLRSMAGDGRCLMALPRGEFRFEVQQLAGSDLLVSLRTAPVKVSGPATLTFPAAPARMLVVRGPGGSTFEPSEFSVRSLRAEGELVWRRGTGGDVLEVVLSPGQKYGLRVLASSGAQHLAWWTQVRASSTLNLDCRRERLNRCEFRWRDPATVPEQCLVTLHWPHSQLELSVERRTQLLTNRRFLGLFYRHTLPGGRWAVFRERQVLLPPPPQNYTFYLGGELTAHGAAAVLENENLGSPDAEQLWWDLALVDPQGQVLDTAASEISWRPNTLLTNGRPVPEPPLSAESLAVLGDPLETVELMATYEWREPTEVSVSPLAFIPLESLRYTSAVPAHMQERMRAYLDKAERVYRAIELVRGIPGRPGHRINVRWWLNSGAVGVHGSITMPIIGMSESFDWTSFPWALAHESLHAFGYPHGDELDRIDRGAQREFSRQTWRIEDDPGYVPGPLLESGR